MPRSLLDDASLDSIGRRRSGPQPRAERAKLAVAAGLFVVAIGLVGWYYDLIPGLRSGPPAAQALTDDERDAFDKVQKDNDALVKAGKVEKSGS